MVLKGLLRQWGVPFKCGSECIIPDQMLDCITGTKGPDGPKGPDTIGPKGPDGIKGPDGPDGTFPFPDCPTTGKHYLTCKTDGTFEWVEESALTGECICA